MGATIEQRHREQQPDSASSPPGAALLVIVLSFSHVSPSFDDTLHALQPTLA
jgi:hypothetical protein